MEPDDGAGSGALDELRELVAGLGAELGSGDLLGWASAGEIADVPGEIYAVLGNAGLLGDAGRPARRGPRGRPAFQVSVPADAAALMDLMWEVDQATALGLLTGLVVANRPRRTRHRDLRPPQPEPRDVFDEVARLIGPAARWWTNTDLSRWNPVTVHAFDAVVVGSGHGIIVTLVAFEGGD
jgi:hypothetical protein